MADRRSSRDADGPLGIAARYSLRFLIVTAAIVVLVYVLIRLRLVVLPVIVALFVTSVLAPPAAWLRKRGWPNILATWTVMLVSLGLFVGLITLLAPSVANELEDMGAAVREGSEDVLEWLAEGPLGISRQEVEDYIDRAADTLRENRETITAGAVSGALLLVEFIAGFFLTLVLVFFFLKDGPKMWEWFLTRVPRRNREHVKQIGTRAWGTIGAYIRGTAIIGVVDAVLIGIALIVVGVPLVAPLMVLTFLAAFLPLVGAVLAGIVASLVALVTQGPLEAAIIAGAILVIQQVEGDVLQPVVMGRAVKLHPVVILVALTAGSILGGVIGGFLAVPIAAVAANVGSYLRSVNNPEPEADPAPA